MDTYKQHTRYLLLLAFMLVNPVLADPTGAPNISFHGALVTEPCTLKPGDESIELQFGLVTDKYLFKNKRTLGLPIELHLQDCDVSQVSTVKVFFSGTESPTLPGFLGLNGSTQGFAIGLERFDGRPLMLNKQSQAWNVDKTEAVISLSAFLQIEPNALVERNITRGDFEAMMLFGLEYD